MPYRGCDRREDGRVLYSVTNGGHTWPGSLDVPRLGHVTDDVNAADLILDFFDDAPASMAPLRPQRNSGITCSAKSRTVVSSG